MKKIIALVIIAILLFSCKTTSVTSTKLDRKSQVEIKGNWVISAVTFGGSEYFKVNSFQIADSQCFVGSTWKFISNNNKGEMALTKTDCPTFSSPITWFVNNEGQFVMKILDAGEKAKKVREGYVLNIANQTPTSFQLTENINVGGKLTVIVYQFQKNN
ncbi:hypothetical protein [Flavobacterium sp.]|uniref:hypothetical protein n=1 Tax=Flavobacterium sp. TaxID=239 RepID=UPI0037A74CF4